jgi:proline-specific peptidase
MKHIVISVLVLLVIVSCGDDTFLKGDFFYLVSKGAQMPVSVRGNKSSGVFILFVHGGPGGTAFQKIGLPAFNELEKDYAMVFWDQRGSGASQGNSDDRLLNLNQFVEDLDKVIDLIRYKYHDPEIFLLGHSWGGCLGTAYLVDDSRQSKIKGWIEADGAHNNPKGDSLSLQWITDYAREQVKKNADVEFWQYALDWYTKNPNFTSDQLEHYAFIEKAHGYIHDPSVKRTPSTYPEYSFQYLFNSPVDVSASFTNYNHVLQHFIISDIDLTSQMVNIKLPALIIWGKYDGIIPYPMAQQAYDALGTDISDKEILTLNDSGHDSFYEEPDVFVSGVKKFIEKYR